MIDGFHLKVVNQPASLPNEVGRLAAVPTDETYFLASKISAKHQSTQRLVKNIV
jgi:hypothetical protein